MQGAHVVGRDARSSVASWGAFAAMVAVGWFALLRLHAGSDASGHADVGRLTTSLGMWSLMTVVMMAPTAVPVLAALRDILAGREVRRWWAFLGAYLAVWSGFSVVAATTQWALAAAAYVDVHGRLSRLPAAAVLLLAGAYQFSSVKARCQTACAAPMQWFLRHWREGTVGAVRMGVRHGVTCVGCCWALMLLAFVGGVGALWTMAVMTALMVVEKSPAIGRRVTVPIGVTLVCAAVLMLVAPAGEPHDHHRVGEGVGRRELA